ncbi:MAG: oligosaccharide flippase family protein [Elusimicrobiales bacterium]
MQDKRPTGSFFKDSALLLANNMLMFAVALGSGILVARGLGPEGRGIYAIAMLFPTLLAGLGGMGINTSLIYFINRHPEERPGAAGGALAYSVGAGIILGLLLTALAGRISTGFLHGSGTVFILAAAPLPLLLLLFETFYCFFMAGRDIGNIAAMNAVKSFTHLTLVSALLFFGSLTVMNTIISQSAAAFAALILGFYALKGNGTFIGISFKWPVFRRMASFGLRQHVGTAAQLLNYRADMFIAAALLSPYQVGLYSVSLAMAEMLWHLPNAAAQVLYPKTTASTKQEADRFTPEVARHVFFITLLPAAAIWAAADPLIGLLFGREFLHAAVPIKLLLPGAVLLSVSKVLGSHLSSRGFPQYNSTASSVSLVSSVTLCLLLIPRWGLAGAATATSISYLANLGVMFYFFRKVSGCGPAELFLPQKSDIRFYRDLLHRAAASKA